MISCPQTSIAVKGETVVEARCGIGFLHTGIEKNLEYRTWTQGVTFVTRMDYLSPFFNEMTYVLGVEKLLGIEDDIPEKASVMRVLLMELNRISSHLVAIATGGMEIGALTVMTIGFRERELVLDLFELITGLRMNHAFIRPGGVAQDLPPGALDEIRRLTGKVEDLEENDMPVADFTIEDMKKQRVKLKDELYHMLLAFRAGQHSPIDEMRATLAARL